MGSSIEDQITDEELDGLENQWHQKELERRQQEEAPEVSEEEWQSLMKQTGEDDEK